MRGQEETAMAYLDKSMNMFEEMEMNFWLPEAQKILCEISKGGSSKWQILKLPQSSKHPLSRFSISSATIPNYTNWDDSQQPYVY